MTVTTVHLPPEPSRPARKPDAPKPGRPPTETAAERTQILDMTALWAAEDTELYAPPPLRARELELMDAVRAGRADHRRLVEELGEQAACDALFAPLPIAEHTVA